MGDTISLNTIILIATRGFHSEALVQGGSNKAESTQRSRSKNMVGMLSCSGQDQVNIYSRLEELNPNAREAIVHP